MITVINELKTLREHISCECKCKFDGAKWNPNKWWNNDVLCGIAKCRCECKKYHICGKD